MMLRSSFSSLLFAILTTALVITGCGGDEASNDASDASAPALPSNDLVLENPWVRPAPSGGNTALYMTLANGRTSPDTLLSVRAPIVDSTQVHETATDTSNTSTMRPIDGLAIPPKSRVALAPGGRHVMLMGLQQTLQDGDTVVLNVEFASAGLRRIQATVRTTAPENEAQ